MSRIEAVLNAAALLAGPHGSDAEDRAAVDRAFRLYDLIATESAKRDEAKRQAESRQPKLPSWAPKEEAA